MKNKLSEEQLIKMLQGSKARHLNLDTLLREQFGQPKFPYKNKSKKIKGK